MRTPHDIDNEESLFQFDPCDEQSMMASSSTGTRANTVSLPKAVDSLSYASLSEESDISNVADDKGKARRSTIPMPIRVSSTSHDLFDISPPNIGSISSFRGLNSPAAFSPISSGSSPSFDDDFQRCNLSIDSMEGMESPEFDFSSVPTSPSVKGKDRESFPMLPPLTFSMMQLDYTFSTPAGPSSSGGTPISPVTVSLPLSQPSYNRESSGERLPRFPPSNSISSTDHPHVSQPHATRAHSLSVLSQELFSMHESVPTNPQSLGSSRLPSNISRQFLDNKQNDNFHSIDTTRRSPGPSAVRPDLIGLEAKSYPLAWYTAPKPLLSSPQVAPHTATSAHAIGTFKGKARSQSFPYPASALDYVPIVSTDIFQPIPFVVINYFDLILPKELRLRILASLVELHEHDFTRSITDGRLTMAKAISSKGRWVGRDKGIRELFKLSRVSRAWQALVFDGELWTNLDLRSFRKLPPAIVFRLIKSAGSFIQHLNFCGYNQLLSSDLSDFTHELSLVVPEALVSFNQLTSINFTGCTYLNTRSIHHLLVRSKALQNLCLKGLEAVTNTTCEIIGNSLPNLTSLNLSRCRNMDGYGISAMLASSVAKQEHMPMKVLRLSGLKYITDSMMQSLGRVMPYLEVLDLSYARQLHNSAIEAFVASDISENLSSEVQTILVSPRDLGREANEYGKVRRRVTKLRHLILSSCFLLSDTACSNLAYSVPNLEFLELAGIGADLKDDGLSRLLSTTPNIRRLDLEDAADITDHLISNLTPQPSLGTGAGTENAKQPGHALEYLNISSASNISEDALIYLMRNCPRLAVLEADNTRIGAETLREFVKLSRERKISNAKIVAIDCRGVAESVVKELSPHTRPRLGWRAYDARKLMYLDARDGDDSDLKIGQDECDEARVVLKSFYSWQTVTAVQAAKEKRRKLSSRRIASEQSMDSTQDTFNARSARWWSPSGRRVTIGAIGRGRNSPPTLPDLTNDGCRTM